MDAYMLACDSEAQTTTWMVRMTQHRVLEA
jgi:hypothetical protein